MLNKEELIFSVVEQIIPDINSGEYEPKEELIFSVVEQIISDINSGEYEPVCELLNILDVKYLESYLPEED